MCCETSIGLIVIHSRQSFLENLKVLYPKEAFSLMYNCAMQREPLEVLVGALLRQRIWRLAVAESCTGGLVGHLLTNVPGSSDYFLGGVISYANEAKQRLLGVRPETLQTYGAVSRQTVLEMAQGVRQLLSADVGLSVSGIAGPGGGSPEKPVGLTWVGLNAPGHEMAWQHFWDGDRLRNKEFSAQAVLQHLVEFLQADPLAQA
jgi:PncC family amidohydrolase